jgi:hypothetical protein
VVGTMLGPVFSIPRDVTFGHSRQWRTMEGPDIVLGGHGELRLGVAESMSINLRISKHCDSNICLLVASMWSSASDSEPL